MDDVATRIRVVFDEVARRGMTSPWLTGDRVTLADLAFAASAAPLMLPTGYTAPIPRFADMPETLMAIASELQAHPAAARAAVVYADYSQADHVKSPRVTG